MRVLAIETSCDESAVAVLDEHRGLLSHQLWSQVDLHRAFGGVVPELDVLCACAAARPPRASIATKVNFAFCIGPLISHKSRRRVSPLYASCWPELPALRPTAHSCTGY